MHHINNILENAILESIIVNTCKIELANKCITLLLDMTVLVYKVGLLTATQDRHMKITLSAVTTYSTDDFNAKVAALQQKQDCEVPQNIDLKLVI